MDADSSDADLIAKHRAKLDGIVGFWGWEIASAHLVWHNSDELSLALWAVLPAGEPAARQWVITEPSGALPVDSIPVGEAPNVRAALLRFANIWADRAAEPIEQRLPPERLARLLSKDPDALARDVRMRQLIGAAAALLEAFAEDAQG